MNPVSTHATRSGRALSLGLVSLRDARQAEARVPASLTPPASARAPAAPLTLLAPPAPLAPLAGTPVTPRAFACCCGRPVFFGNSQCLACRTPLGYEPDGHRLMSLEPAGPALNEAHRLGTAPPETFWRQVSADATAPRWRRCRNLDTAAACNWVVAEGDTLSGDPPLCRSCRLTRTVPDLSVPEHAGWWNRIEQAKRRLVSSLIGLNLPVHSKINEDPQRGLVFDLLRAAPGAPPVITGHADGVITLDVEEADDAWREQRRAALGEPYRTLLGHLRHETGHYYWQRLVQGGRWLRPWRVQFGDERQDYAAALRRHYVQGPRPDWGQQFVSAYASSHPWEDWAETWAHYLHLVDTLDTARSFGLDGESVELSYARYSVKDLGTGEGAQALEFLKLMQNWMELTGVLNELSRSMGVPDFYPFVLSLPALRKLFLVHRVIAATRSASLAVALT